MGLSFEERWKKIMKNYRQRVRNDEGLTTLNKKYRKLLQKTEKTRTRISVRQTEILSEEVEREFCS